MTGTTLKKLIAAGLGIFLLHSTTWAENIDATADIVFKGTSTLHEFEGTVTTQPFVASFTEDSESGILNVAAKAALNIQDMTTSNRKRDKNMYKMFDLEHYNIIEAELVDVAISEKTDTQATLHLKIHDVEHDVAVTISKVQRDGDGIRCTMSFPVSLTAFGLKPPSVMGIINVDDTVLVQCTITGRIRSTETKG